MKRQSPIIEVEFKGRGFIGWTIGVLYKENAKFVVLCNNFPAYEEFSWSSQIDFMVIPRKLVTRLHYIAES